MKEKLIKLIETLNEDEIKYIYELVKQLFKGF